MKRLLIGFVFFLLINAFSVVLAQNNATIYGYVKDQSGRLIENANIVILGVPGGTVSNLNGYYELKAPVNDSLIIVVTYIGFRQNSKKIPPLVPGQRYLQNLSLSSYVEELPSTVIVAKQDFDKTNIQKINPKEIKNIPVASGGGVEALIKTLPGVSSNNELSSQYSVRGGNFDENLIYVNDIEIYRPFLVRSGQQEGLSFINSDMVSTINFSAGGFEAKYGDKMASVLNVEYRRPIEFSATVNMSMLGGGIQIENLIAKGKLSYIIGVRNKNMQYVLKSMDTKGDYKPSFTDIQTAWIYDLNNKWELSFLGGYASNVYKVIPQTRVSSFGTINEAMQLKVYFDGQEVDKYSTSMGALSATYNPNKQLKLKFISSVFRTVESESYDISGEYWLDQLESGFGEDNFGGVAYNRGVGAYLRHARNYLDAYIANFSHKGNYKWKNKNILEWGAKYQYELINDKISEWDLIDSSDFSLPRITDSIGYLNPSVQPLQYLNLKSSLKKENILISSRLSTYVQNMWIFDLQKGKLSLIAGLRSGYWTVNDELTITPRVNVAFKPNWKKNYLFRASSGLYYQPPFYRELRNFNGELNKDIKAQRSVHYLLGMDYEFKAWNRPFKMTTEAYFKSFYRLIPYEVDNVRIGYYADNIANGYGTGIDLKINGEFVKGIESWLSVSIMKTEEDLYDDYYLMSYNKEGKLIIPGVTLDQNVEKQVKKEIGFIPRPTDQRVSVNLYFQDYLPMDSTFKMHLNLVYATGLPFGPPNMERSGDTLQMPAYRRVDIGFSKLLKSEDKVLPKSNIFHYFSSIWVSLEVFNLLQINNTISYMWVKDISNQQYAIPSYLTPRMVNLKLIAKF